MKNYKENKTSFKFNKENNISASMIISVENKIPVKICNGIIQILSNYKIDAVLDKPESSKIDLFIPLLERACTL